MTRKGLSESEEESGIKEESSLEMGERGGGLGVPGICPAQGGGMGMATDKLGGAEEDRSPSGKGSPSPWQAQQTEL